MEPSFRCSDLLRINIAARANDEDINEIFVGVQPGSGPMTSGAPLRLRTTTPRLRLAPLSRQ